MTANMAYHPGFIVLDHPELLGKAREELAGWIKEGKITNSEGETVIEASFEQIPETYQKLFHGANKGKLITKLV
jgi:NADPH-dependent curcumin reductase CurA